MAPMASELATLRALSFRISSTPTSQLPQHVPAIAASLASCRTILSSPQTSGIKATSSEYSVAVHKFRTLLSTLLQDRTPHGRWCAIVLIKATIEVGGWETLQKSLPWVRGLLGFLNKPDPPSSKKLCIITLTRIFFLTREYPTLVREITTPSLTPFVQAGLQIANAANTPASLLQVVLESFNQLLPRHPTIFRSYLKQLHPLIARLIAPTPSTKISQEETPGFKYGTVSEIAAAARQLYVQLPYCAPKGTSGEDWTKSVKNVVNSTHQTADHVFRAVVEDWQSTAREAPLANGHTIEDEPQDLEPSSGLPPWSGIFAGGERLVGLLYLLKDYVESPTTSTVFLDVGLMVDLISRILSITIPVSSSKSFQSAVRLNAQVSKEERENLWLLIPEVHVAAIEVLLALAHRTQSSTIALDPIIVDQIVWVFNAEKDTVQVRTACYVAMSVMLRRSGVALHKSTIDSLLPLIRSCCEDLLPSSAASTTVKQAPNPKANGNTQSQTTANADAFLSASKETDNSLAGFAGLFQAVHDLLPVLLSNIRAQYLSDSMRARLDRTAILAQHKEAMVASVLNPPPSKKFGKPAASIVPFMARSFPAEKDVEGMLRPRMPVISLGSRDSDMEEEEDEMDVEEDEEEQEAVETQPSAETDNDMPEAAGTNGTAVKDFAMVDVLDTSILAPISSGSISTTRDPQYTLLRDPSASGDTKRPIGDEGPRSPSKRAKTDEDELPPTHLIPPVSEATVPFKDTSFDAAASATSDFTATSTASVIPELPGPGEGDDGDDDDDDSDNDKISLVLGQDTDDDSD
jgi:pre-rRNA-processing protein RIX1